MSSLLESLRAGPGSRLFVHCATSVAYSAELEGSIPGLPRYAERALVLAELQDLVCLPDEVDPAYLEYLSRLELGPDPANLVVMSPIEGGVTRPLWHRLLKNAEALRMASDLMRRRATSRLHPFIASAGQFELAWALSERTGFPVRVLGGDPAFIAYADCKHHIRMKALELGVPVAPGEVVDLGTMNGSPEAAYEALLAAIDRQIGGTGRVLIRGACGAAGSSTFIADGCEGDRRELARELARRMDNRIYLVEMMLEPTVSPSIQMHINAENGSVECVGVTDQRLNGELAHEGNVFPSVARCMSEMIGWARTLSEWLLKEGFSGIAGFDFVEYADPDGSPKAFLAELNPRVIAATYSLAAAERLGASAFVSGTVATGLETFAAVREALQDLLFSREQGSGVLPCATGLLEYGKCGVIALAHSREEATELYAAAESAMGATCVIG